MRAALFPVLGIALASAWLFAQSAETTIGVRYVPDQERLKLPTDRTEIGSMHGDVAVSAVGEVYISVEGSVRQRFAILGPNPGLQVYAPDGRFLHNVVGAPSDLHGFIIHREAGTEYIYGARLAAGPSLADQTRAGVDGEIVVKMTLDGTVAMTIPASRIPEQFKNKGADGQSYTRLTGIAVAPNGDLYVADGYASDYIHRFDRNGRYLASFGGKQAPYGFRTLHKLTIDTRFQPARLLACDRENGRVVHLSLDGALLGIVASDLRRPAAVAVRGEYAAIGELQGRVTLLDKGGQVAGTLGENTVADEIASNRTEPSKWRSGIVTAPHGVAFNARGDLFVSEFNLAGRVHHFAAQAGSASLNIIR